MQNEKIIIYCANIQYWQCFFIVTNFICDYEKQIVITNVKNNQHCSICQILSKKQKHLTRKQLTRIHKLIQKQIQRKKKTIEFFSRTINEFRK